MLWSKKWMVCIGLLLLMTGCDSAAKSREIELSAAPAVKTSQSDADLIKWTADGVISPNEYKHYQKIGEVEFYSKTEGEHVCLAMTAETTGYIALGINPGSAMQNADIIIGYVEGDKAVLEDHHSANRTGPHQEDEEKGGTNDIAVFGGTEKDGVTTIEFKRDLTTGDQWDNVIRKGENKIIWALRDQDDLYKRHSKEGSGTLTLP